MKHSLISCAVLACASLAQVPTSPHSERTLDVARQPVSGWPFDRVMYDAPGDGRLWARGANWKASFGVEGLTYYPYVPGAQRNWPVGFRIAGVRVGGVPVTCAAVAAPHRDGDRVWFDRGAVREVYDLGLREVEQTFVVDTRLAGDVEIDLAVDSQLREDAALPGLQFGGAEGALHYGDAFLVRDAEKLAIESSWDGSAIRLRVPAALRGTGPVVIDPILTTRNSTAGGAIYQPDVAWDETNQRYLIVWEMEWSAADHDIWTEMFDAAGDVIPVSGAAIDSSAVYWGRPRVANLNQFDRFLVAAEVIDPQHNQRHMIYGRTRDAGGNTAVQPAVLLSDPARPGDNFSAAVGADPGTAAGPHHWFVVWTNGGGNDYNAHGRLVDGTGAPVQQNVIVIADGLDQLNTNVQVSRSNGNGVVPHPRWFTVFSRHEAQSGWNVYGRTIDPVGIPGPVVDLDTSTSEDLYPRVSSPITDPAGKTRFLVTYERQIPAAARAILVTVGTTGNSYSYHDLTDRFGLDPFWVRAESDGARFAVTAGTSTTIRVRTFAVLNGSLLLQDGPHVLSGGTTSLPEVCSRRSSGGVVGEYGITYLRHQGATAQPILVRYAGQAVGPTITVLPTACDGLQIDVAGSSAVGGAVQFALSNFGAGLPGFAFGAPNVSPVPICANCSLGLRLDLPIVPLFGSPTLQVSIPVDAGMVGATFAIQGIAVGPGTCFGALTFSDTIAFTIR